MIFTPDERRALLVLSLLTAIGLLLRATGIGTPGPPGGGDSLLVVLAEKPETDRSPPPGFLEEGRVWINEADAADLTLLPRVGPVMAERIVEDRRRNGPYQSWRSLTRVRGIGEKTARILDPLVSYRLREGESAAGCTVGVQGAIDPTSGVINIADN